MKTKASINIPSKLPLAGTTIFSVMSKLAHEENAINLSQGFPDFMGSEKLISLVNEYMRKGYNQYAPMSGIPELREAIAEKTKRLHNVSYDPDTEITVTSGATQAIFTAISAVVCEGDEVIIFTPAYDCYEPAIILNGGKANFIQLKAPTYAFDWSEVKKVINRKTKMIIINTPHNPTGSVMTESDMRELEHITRDSNIIILSDEVYEHVIFDGKQHQSVSRFPGLAERSFVVSSFGKTFHNTGWKMGYCVAPKALMAEFRKAHQYIVFSCNTPIQHALADFISDEENYLELNSFYQRKRDLFADLIKSSRFKIVPCHGTYFQVLDYTDISDEKDTDMAIRMTKEHKLASIPISVFYHKEIDNKVLRFCFAKEEETLKKAAAIINSI